MMKICSAKYSFFMMDNRQMTWDEESNIEALMLSFVLPHRQWLRKVIRSIKFRMKHPQILALQNLNANLPNVDIIIKRKPVKQQLLIFNVSSAYAQGKTQTAITHEEDSGWGCGREVSVKRNRRKMFFEDIKISSVIITAKLFFQGSYVTLPPVH